MKNVLAAIVLVSLWSPNQADAQRRKAPEKQPKITNIGIVYDGPWQRNAMLTTLLEGEILGLVKGEFNVSFPADKKLTADWTADGVKRAIDQLLADPDVDIVLTLGVLASNDACHREKLPKPVLAPYIVDASLQGVPQKKGRSGRKNLNYLTVPLTMEHELEVFRRVVDFNRLTVLANKVFVEAVPGLAERTRSAGEKLNISIDVVTVGSSIQEALSKIPAGTEAVYVAPLLQLSPEEFATLNKGLIARKLPSFSQLGKLEVENGLMVGLRPASNFQQISRRIALNVQRILFGDDPARFTVNLRLNEQLVINMATVRAIEKWPNLGIVIEAELLNAERANIERKLSLAGVMKEAMEGNVDLAALREGIAVGEQDVRRARSVLFPSVDVSTTARIIDSPTAASSVGLQPQFLWNGSIQVTQLLYSDKARASVKIQKDVQASRTEEYESKSLDVVLETATAYLNVLRAKSLERIQQNDLKVTRENLELARTRQQVGTANKADVYRWEAELANDRKAVIESIALRNVATGNLNRILKRPVDELYDTEDTSLTDPRLLTSQQQLFRFIQNQWIFKIFRRFMIQEAVSQAPELKQLDAAIAVQQRVLTSAKRSYWAPNVALQGQVNQRFVRAGEGSSPPDLMVPGLTIDGGPSFSWSVGLVVSLPLYEGGARSADVKKAKLEIRRLQTQRQGIYDRLAQRVDASIYNMSSKFVGIGFSQQAAEAAKKNLELVKQAYSQGALTIVQLLDAQNAALQSEQVAANAVYDFLIEWMNVQRAIGRFDVLMDDAAKTDFFKRANEYVSAAKNKDSAPRQ